MTLQAEEQETPVGADSFCWRVIWLICLLMTGSLVLWTRFYQITEIGITGSDTFWYWANGKLWAQGRMNFFDANGGEFFRPVAFLLHALGFKLFGHHDWTIKVIHAGMDFFSFLIIAYVTIRLTANRWMGLMVAFFYAVNPFSIEYARNEAVHGLSTLFLLLTYLPLIPMMDKDSPWRQPSHDVMWAFLVGLCVSCAAGTHEDILLLSPGLLLGLVLHSLAGMSVSSMGRIWTAGRRAFAFCLGAGFVYLIFTAILGYEHVYEMVFGVKDMVFDKGYDTLKQPTFLAYAWIRLEDIRFSMTLIFGAMGTILAYAAPVVLTSSLVWRKSRLWPGLVAISGVLSYLLLFSILLPWPFQRSDARVVYPLLMFSLPAIWASTYHFFKALMETLPCHVKWPFGFLHCKKKTRGFFLVAIGFGVLGIMFTTEAVAPRSPFHTLKSIFLQRANPMRWLAETVLPHLTEDKKLLIVPSIALAGRYGLQNLPYTDIDKIMYLVQADRPGEDASFEEILRHRRIGFVFVTKLVRQELANSNTIRYDTIEKSRIVGWPLNIVPGHCFGMTRGEYDQKNELKTIHKVLDRLGARVFATSDLYGAVYAVPHFPAASVS